MLKNICIHKRLNSSFHSKYTWYLSQNFLRIPILLISSLNENLKIMPALYLNFLIWISYDFLVNIITKMNALKENYVFPMLNIPIFRSLQSIFVFKPSEKLCGLALLEILFNWQESAEFFQQDIFTSVKRFSKLCPELFYYRIEKKRGGLK